MSKELKKAIVNYMFDNAAEFQLSNDTRAKFKQYIYDETGNYCFGGSDVSDFITAAEKLVRGY